MRNLTLIVMVLFGVSGCSLFLKRVDPSIVYTTPTGFQFKVPKIGAWYARTMTADQYMFGQKPLDDDTTKILVAHHGPVQAAAQGMTNKEVLQTFQNIIVREAKIGRARNVKNDFEQKKYKGADCLMFTQFGQDTPGNLVMDMSNEGMVCLHPTKKQTYVWLAISERRPVGKASSVGDEKLQFFESLEFTN